MIADGLTFNLILTAFLVGLFGFIVLRRQVGNGLGLFIAIFKVSIPLFYFAFFNDGTWLQIDDRVYYFQSLKIKAGELSLLHDLFDPIDKHSVSHFVGSEHRLYFWWNVLAFYLFGDFYYSPVFLNVALTFVGATMLRLLIGSFNFSRDYTKSLLVFFMLHWDVVVWSSFVNLKDTLVLTLTIAALLLLNSLRSRFSLPTCIGVSLIFYLFTMLRQYLPPLLLTAFALSMLRRLETKKKVVGLLLTGVGLIYLAPWETEHVDYFHLQFPLWNSIRFLLMPQFWHVEPEREGFIFIPSIFHWLLFLPMIYGGISLWRGYPQARLLFFYFVIMVLFYSVVPELQGTRQRFQLVFLTAWMQFHALWELLPATSTQEFYRKSRSHLLTSSVEREEIPAVVG